ncbi:MAG: Uma2 family endonuclease [Acidobacteriota bacterium]|nr:Uma2 family endonuclease [Acidobacteriota bacterium]
MQQTNTEIQTSAAPFLYEMEENGFENEHVKVHLWTREQYYKMAELGFFDGKKVELIEGEIIEMSPMKTLHATALSLLVELLGLVFSKEFTIRSQLPMTFGETTEPEPDIAVVKGKIRDFSAAHPKTAALVVEVSDSTLRYDQTKKATLYAKNKIQEFWILNLKNRCLEVYRRPIKDKKLGFIYTEIQIVTENNQIVPLAAPDAPIKVADMLP